MFSELSQNCLTEIQLCLQPYSYRNLRKIFQCFFCLQIFISVVPIWCQQMAVAGPRSGFDGKVETRLGEGGE